MFFLPQLSFNSLRRDVFGGLLGTGATMRTMVNVKAGGKIQFSGMFHALVLLTIVLGFDGICGAYLSGWSRRCYCIITVR